MSDCVYHAWAQHMHHLNASLNVLSWDMYNLIRMGIGNERGPTYGGIVPVIVKTLSEAYGCSMRVQHRIWTPEMYITDVVHGKSGLDIGPNEMYRFYAVHLIDDASKEGLFGEEVERITLEPAIYLLLNTSHAMFSETVPKGGPIMALQVYKLREEK